MTNKITIETTVHAPVEQVWERWNGPAHVTKWNAASDDWHTTKAESDLRPGGAFSARMEAKDGSFGFDFAGVYDTVEQHKNLSYTIADGRKVNIDFSANEDGSTHIVQTFEAEGTNPEDMQRQGWQAILNNFKAYCEGGNS